jgi:hypothetical protein
MMTEKSMARRVARLTLRQASRRRDRIGLMTKRSKLRLIKRHLAKAGFSLGPTMWEMACPTCLNYRARFIWTIEPQASPKWKARESDKKERSQLRGSKSF